MWRENAVVVSFFVSGPFPFLICPSPTNKHMKQTESPVHFLDIISSQGVQRRGCLSVMLGVGAEIPKGQLSRLVPGESPPNSNLSDPFHVKGTWAILSYFLFTVQTRMKIKCFCPLYPMLISLCFYLGHSKQGLSSISKALTLELWGWCGKIFFLPSELMCNVCCFFCLSFWYPV